MDVDLVADLTSRKPVPKAAANRRIVCGVLSWPLTATSDAPAARSRVTASSMSGSDLERCADASLGSGACGPNARRHLRTTREHVVSRPSREQRTRSRSLWTAFARPGAGERDADAYGRGEARRSLVVLLTRLLDEHIDRHRWRIERALSWLSCFRRLQVRWDRDAGRWFALVLLACAVVCFNRL